MKVDVKKTVLESLLGVAVSLGTSALMAVAKTIYTGVKIHRMADKIRKEDSQPVEVEIEVEHGTEPENVELTEG